ncbi:hypothetical protein ASE63_26165 [Bosea sp. Root381]|nr:hypothetical protein ASE63_26165 [Bosea sp. Root381]
MAFLDYARHVAFAAPDVRRSEQPALEWSALLASVLGPSSAIRMSEDVDADGESFFRIACEMKLEGIIAPALRLRPRWRVAEDQVRAVRDVRRLSRRSERFGGLARMLLAAREVNGLIYVGSVGTGFSARSAADLRRLLDEMASPEPAIPVEKSGTRWVDPAVAVEVEVREWTDDSKLRHASFKAIRDDAELDDVLDVSGAAESGRRK